MCAMQFSPAKEPNVSCSTKNTIPHCIKKNILPKGGKFKNQLNKIIQRMHLFYISLYIRVYLTFAQ